jgi:PEP-CTERM motif
VKNHSLAATLAVFGIGCSSEGAVKKTNWLKACMGAAAVWAATAAQAALTPVAPACTATATNASWSDCAGAFQGNDKNQLADVLATIQTEFGLAGALFQGASDDALGGPFSGNPSGASGTLSFDTAIDAPFVLAIKAGNAFSLFYFDGIGAAVSSIDYTTLGVSTNGNGIGSGLSHASVYAVSMVQGIPEPHTYALMLAGLVAIGFMSRRRQRS